MQLSEVRQLSAVDRYLYWVAERERIRLLKEAGAPWPWTDDDILRTYRFCNVRRMDDRVSRWLLENWYGPYRDHPNTLPATALARFFNLPAALGPITDLVYGARPVPWLQVKSCLRRLHKSQTIFNGAYMVRGNDGEDKVAAVVDFYIGSVVTANVVPDPGSMQTTWAKLIPLFGWGSFMAGQVVADLRYALTGTWADKDEWAPLGPGSRRGLNRLLDRPTTASVSQERFVVELNGVIELCEDSLPPILTERLEAMDYQNTLCEFDGYEKVLWGQGRKKEVYNPDRDKYGVVKWLL